MVDRKYLKLILATLLIIALITGYGGFCSKKSESGSSALPQSPSLITNLATDITQTSATLNGTVNPNGSNVTSCYFDYGDTEEYGSQTAVSPLPGSGTNSVSVSATLSSLSADTEYDFRVVATNAGGTTNGNNLTFTTIVAAPAQVGSPSPANSATGIPITQPLSWGEASGAISYGIYFGTSEPPPFIITNTGYTNTTYNPGALLNNTTYYWQINSSNAGGTTTGIVWSFQTEVPPITPPDQVTSPNPVDGAINVFLTQQLIWAAASGATSYDVYFGITTTGWSPVTNTVLTSFSPPVLLYSTTYYWRIDSKNSSGTTNGNTWSFQTVTATTEDVFSVFFIDVGQGDSELIKTNQNHYVLIDSGPSDASNRVNSFLNSKGVTSIEKAILTHPHTDHYGEFKDVVGNYIMGSFLFANYPSTNSTYLTLIDKLAVNSVPTVEVNDGYSFSLDNLTFRIYHPPSGFIDTSSDVNDNSLAIKISNTSGIDLLICGDIETAGMASLVERHGNDIDVELLKINHHGSSNGTNQTFLDKTTPTDAFICVGAGNSYGHPATETLTLLSTNGINVYRTDQNGNITVSVTSSGYSISTQK